MTLFNKFLPYLTDHFLCVNNKQSLVKPTVSVLMNNLFPMLNLPVIVKQNIILTLSGSREGICSASNPGLIGDLAQAWIMLSGDHNVDKVLTLCTLQPSVVS